MMRQFVPLACLGTALLPAGALALGWRTYYVPCAPPICYLPPVVFLPDCAPPVEFYYPAPLIAPVPASPAAPKVTQDPPARPVPAKPDAPAPAPAAPKVGAPRGGLDVPEGRPADAVRIPATVPVLPVTPAVTPAESPAAPDPVRLPPLVPRVPGNEGGLPPLKINPPAGPSTSNSSPLADRRAFEVVPVAGTAVPALGALRSVGIFNHTDRDVTLTVEGETVTLPARSYVTAAVPRQFRWRLGAGESQSTEVPRDAPGVEIVLRR